MAQRGPCLQFLFCCPAPRGTCMYVRGGSRAFSDDPKRRSRRLPSYVRGGSGASNVVRGGSRGSSYGASSLRSPSPTHLIHGPQGCTGILTTPRVLGEGPSHQGSCISGADFLGRKFPSGSPPPPCDRRMRSVWRRCWYGKECAT